MKKHLIIALLAASHSIGASAATVFSTSKVAFLSANTGLTLEDFEGSSLASGNNTGFAGPLNSSTNNSTYAANSVKSGFSLTATSGNIYADRDFGGNVGATVSADNFDANINIIFNNIVTAASIDLLQWLGNTGDWTIEAFDAFDVSLGSIVATTTDTPTFIGIKSDVAIKRIFLDKPDNGAVIDDLRFGNPSSVPAPAAVWLLGSAVGLFALRRKNSL